MKNAKAVTSTRMTGSFQLDADDMAAGGRKLLGSAVEDCGILYSLYWWVRTALMHRCSI